MFLSGSGQDIEALFYLFDLFKGPFIILFGLNGFYHSGGTSFANAKVMVNPVSMGIALIDHKISSKANKLVKIFCLKLLKVNLNPVPETIIFGVCGCVLIQRMYDYC